MATLHRNQVKHTVLIQAETYTTLEQLAKETDRPISYVIRKALASYLASQQA